MTGFVKHGLIIAIITFILAFLAFSVSKPISALLVFIACGILYFFRDPRRIVIKSDNLVLSPADGRVINIEKVNYNEFLESGGTKINIFLSLWNVHINRAPIKGKIEYTHYEPGGNLPAFLKRASNFNERNTFGIKGDFNIIVTQISGFIARCIVVWKNQGDLIQQGDKIGMIRFGSGTEIIVPEDIEVKVSVGDNVKAGKTIIGEVKKEKK